jgi:hypothetical protein
MAGTQLLEQWKTILEHYKLSWREPGRTGLSEQGNHGAESSVARVIGECMAV